MLTKIEDGKLQLTKTQADAVLRCLASLRDVGAVLTEHYTQAGDLMTITVGGMSYDISKTASEDVVALLRGERLRLRKKLREVYGIVIE